MIEVGSGTISILYADGTSAVFDPEELRIRLEKSFLSSETGDIWIAGELVLAVEFALQKHLSDTNCSAINANEIDDCVERILEDSGFAAAARMFRSQKISSGEFGRLSADGVEQYLLEKLQLPQEKSRKLADSVISAMRAIGINRCSPRLILELARHFREQTAVSFSPPRVPQQFIQTNQPAITESSVFKIHRSDAVFASVRAEIDLTALFQNCNLTPPLTEFSLTPRLLSVTEKIDSEYTRLLEEKKDTDYPLLLTLQNFSEFCFKWLCFENGMDSVKQEKRTRAFTAYLRSLMQTKPFKIFVR